MNRGAPEMSLLCTLGTAVHRLGTAVIIYSIDFIFIFRDLWLQTTVTSYWIGFFLKQNIVGHLSTIT